MDTIVACSSPWGLGGVSLIRISGPAALSIVKALSSRSSFIPRKQHYCQLIDGTKLIDQVLVCYMPNPNSFTGEDVVEISCHGNPVLVEWILDACVRAGARPARHGEFTRRAVENKKLSLLQAEALQGLIHARTIEGIGWAHQGLAGEMDEGIVRLREQLLDFCAEMEARLDYPQEGLEYINDVQLAKQVEKLAQDCQSQAETWQAGKIRLHGAKVAILGPVNAGKSSLFNQLVGSERAIVSDVPGTTRDVVEKSILLDGLEVCFLDTAGARENTTDVLEKQGMQLGIEMAQDVDLCLLLVPLHLAEQQTIQKIQEKLSHQRIVLVGTHVDLQPETPRKVDCVISNKTGQGIDKLRDIIKESLRKMPTSGASWVILSQRQHELFLSISQHLQLASDALLGEFGPAIAAEEIIQALERLGELSGEDVRESILDRLFSRFCIGK